MRTLALAIAAAMALVACGRGDDSDTGDRPGNPAVHSRIEQADDCATVQGEFDQASENNELAEPGTQQFDQTLGYMEAADARLDELGCYG